MTTKIYFTLKELLNDDRFIINLTNNKKGIEDIIDSLYVDIEGSLPASDTISQELLSHVWANMSDKYVLSFDVVHPRWVNVDKESYDIPETEWDNSRARLAQSIWSIYIDTQDKYRTLINLYNDELDNLLNPIDTSSETRFNDTPQNILNAGEYADDNFSTTVTKSKVSTDGSSKMNRINEIYDMLRNLYADWAFEFNKLVIGE